MERPKDLVTVIATLLAEARTSWPWLALDEEKLASFVTERANDADAAPSADLVLAYACAQRNEKAIEAFERRYFGEVDAVLARVRDPSLNADDVRQMLREKLFVGSAGAKPKILDYAGRGALGAWFRVTAMRTVLNLVRGRKEIPVDADTLLCTPGGSMDPELEHLKRRYRAEFEIAFADAVAGLGAREKSLLSYAFSDGLGSAEIAAIYGVHRTTANRWLADLRQSLLAGVRAAMLKRLRVDKGELESILRLIRSQLEVTLSPR
jgi:RNA polymerase sigma-70 factor (ECF subfamily)